MRLKRRWLIVGVGVVAAVGAVAGWLWFSRPIIPSSIRSQLSFAVFYPSNNDPARADRTSIKYDAGKKILTYGASLGSVHLIVTNQASPDIFADVPATYTRVISSMNPYADFKGSNGQVSLTRPPGSGNRQVAVVNTQGTLIFVRADHDLTEDQWRQFINGLTVLHS